MGDRQTVGEGRSRLMSLSVGAIISMVLLAFAILFASSFSTRLVAANARALHWTNATLGTAAIVRAAANQASLFGSQVEAGLAADEALEIAVDELRRTRAVLDDRAREAAQALGEPDSDLALLFERFQTATLAVQDHLETGDATAARSALEQGVEPEYRALAASLSSSQDDILGRIAETESRAGLIGGATRFMVVLLLPTAAIVTYRQLIKRRLREERLEMGARLEYQQRLSRAKDDLIAGISHELRTPLTSIYGLSEILAEEPAIAGDPAELVAMINVQSLELTRMVEDLLAASRIEAGSIGFDIEDLDIGREIENAIDRARKHGLDVDTELPAGLIAAADRARLAHILRNLLSNAHRHGGPQTRVIAERSQDKVVVHVDDNGAGIDAGKQLFRAFVNEGKGAVVNGSVGLGLAVARDLAEAMDGAIVHQRLEGWTRFTLEFPAVTVEEPEAAPAADERATGGRPGVGGHTGPGVVAGRPGGHQRVVSRLVRLDLLFRQRRDAYLVRPLG